ncbi:bifunctional UDP-N-acetylglucosamine pyrophosphorylase/glucosamine-1-phosphate N-acetyltransferase [Halarchaeum rubridurum]|uniref:Bifunctional protein GlmU n=1 Tax=Halarchaeum rubridurum TaxID=489911 RepID=A0A830FUY0_9EURY|nr:bifunctional sugar-1-phosphate nucleotidylyltransferase/acetyltransferase [Halarchaeum rubridurum]MBP1953472.1 bifunctional UDP-N-acetylglucosamine pyrophosphorylase/glucosamine-1-phosphate N-acetyltransferase [Halarchaeum rubridurum]GGM64983.1 glucose-1-phosphate thymidylyltransferase [Halarchaeum rubridurum]
MQTVVLAAGRGTRMRPLTDRRLKPMLPVAGRPLVAHTVEAAADAGASRVVLVIQPDDDTVSEHFGDEHAGVDLDYAVQTEQRGTADAVRAAAPHLDDAPFVVLNGDALYDHDSLAALYERAPAVGAFRVDDPTQYGVLLTDEAGERVTGVVEKPADPPSDLVNTGAYALPAEAKAWLDVGESERGELEFTDVLARACETHEVRPVAFERWLDVGRPWELLEANEWKLGEMAGRVDGEVHPDAELTGDVVVEAGATVRSGVVVEGPAYIKAGATVGPNAYVRGASYVGPDAKVGHAVEVKNSVMMADAHAGHLAYVGDSVLGRGTNLGAGTKVANLRHDGAPVKTLVKGEVVSTGRRKFGVILGDDAKTGINTSLNAGVKLPTEGATRPGEVVMFDPDSERARRERNGGGEGREGAGSDGSDDRR